MFIFKDASTTLRNLRNSNPGYYALIAANTILAHAHADGEEGEYVVLKFKRGSRDLIQFIHDLLKEIPVNNGLFRLPSTCQALKDISFTKKVSSRNRQIISSNFASLHLALSNYYDNDYPVGSTTIFDNPLYAGLETILQTVITKFDQFTQAASVQSVMNEWTEGGEIGRTVDFNNGCVLYGKNGSRALSPHALPVRSNIPSTRGSSHPVDTDPTCSKDYGKKHADLVPGLILLCCVHGFILGEASDYVFIPVFLSPTIH